MTKKILSTKELICILATLLIVTGIHVLAGLCAAAQPTTIKGLVVGVSDGDTIKILTPAKEELRIRLYGRLPGEKAGIRPGSQKVHLRSGLQEKRLGDSSGHRQIREKGWTCLLRPGVRQR